MVVAKDSRSLNPQLSTRNRPWGCSSVGRAVALQAIGREFESPQLHQPSLLRGYGSASQPQRVEGWARRAEALAKAGRVAQLVRARA